MIYIPPCLLCLRLNAFKIADLFLGATVSAGRAERQSWGKHGAATPSDPMSLLPPASSKTVAWRGRAEPVQDAEVGKSCRSGWRCTAEYLSRARWCNHGWLE